MAAQSLRLFSLWVGQFVATAHLHTWAEALLAARLCEHLSIEIKEF
jgi:hypothetical protein